MLGVSRCAATTVLVIVVYCSICLSDGSGDTNLKDVYVANQGDCDFFVGQDGNDYNDGSTWKYPFATLSCAADPNCNNAVEEGNIICILAGKYETYDTIRPARGVVFRALGPPHSVIFDGMGQNPLFNTGRQNVGFVGIHFTNGQGNSGGAIYAEAPISFDHCKFSDNVGTLDGGAVLVSRGAIFKSCEFYGNTAVYAGAVRISDIATAEFENCTFYHNRGEKKGGAIITQIEKPESQYVKIRDTMFCFNDAPEGHTIYNFRTKTHECTNCSFNKRNCCNDHGSVTENVDQIALEEGYIPTRVCQCDSGWAGLYCSESSEVKQEL